MDSFGFTHGSINRFMIGAFQVPSHYSHDLLTFPDCLGVNDSQLLIYLKM
jgi:hypothetical protein